MVVTMKDGIHVVLVIRTLLESTDVHGVNNDLGTTCLPDTLCTQIREHEDAEKPTLKITVCGEPEYVALPVASSEASTNRRGRDGCLERDQRWSQGFRRRQRP